MRTPIGRVPWWTVLIANVLFWPAWTFGCGYAMNAAPRRAFARDTTLTRPRGFEREGRFYAETLQVRRWKDHLPEAGALFAGGFAKREVAAGDVDQLTRFVDETRRAEWTHWAAVSGAVVPMLWNPWWAFPVHAAVAAGANLPCVVVQRYNRARLVRLLARVERRSTVAPTSAVSGRAASPSGPSQ